MQATLRKWRAVFGITIQDTFAYRASLVIWILTDLVTAITMPLVWASAAGNGKIQGMSTGDFAIYYLAMLQIGSFVTSHLMWDIAFEIKEGIFSVYLVRPLSFFQYEFFRNFAWRIIRAGFTLPFLLILMLLFRPLYEGGTIHLGWEVWTSIALGHLVSFTLVISMAMVALFVQEAFAIFELYYLPMMFLSGYLVPVSLLPGWAHALAKFLPFYYTTGVPTEMAVGRLTGPDAHTAMLIQVGWIILHVIAGRILWKFGLKHYTGVGM